MWPTLQGRLHTALSGHREGPPRKGCQPPEDGGHGSWATRHPSVPPPLPVSPSLVRPSRGVSAPRRGPRCLGVKTIFSSGPKANFFLRLPDSETPNGIPSLFLSLLAPALQNHLLPNKVVPGTQNLVIRHFSSFVPRLFQVSPCHLPLQSHLFHCLWTPFIKEKNKILHFHKSSSSRVTVLLFRKLSP